MTDEELRRLKRPDLLELLVMRQWSDANVSTYAVVEVEVLDKTALEEMEAGDWALTLFTCTYGGQTRLTVGCA